MMRRVFRFYVLAAVATLLSSCFALMDANEHISETSRLLEVQWNEEVGTKYDGLVYADSLKLDLYVPCKTTNGNARHLILYIHGGGWTEGNRTDGELWCKYLTAKGFTTASIDYTLRSKRIMTDINKVDSQVCAAVMMLKNYASEHGFTLEDMAVTGFSAGGCQALLYAYKHAGDSPLPIRFVFQQSGPTTFEPSTWEPGNGLHWYVNWTTGVDGTDEGAAEWLSLMTGQSITAAMVRNGSAQPYIDAISPLYYITETTVPTLSLYGECDGVVPPCHSTLLEEKLSSNHVDHIGLSAPNSGHALAFDIEVQKLFIEIVDAWCKDRF